MSYVRVCFNLFHVFSLLGIFPVLCSGLFQSVSRFQFDRYVSCSMSMSVSVIAGFPERPRGDNADSDHVYAQISSRKQKEKSSLPEQCTQ